MKQTTNYLMHLPEVSDYVDIDVLDENTVKIDGELKKAETHRGEGTSHVTPAEKARWDGKAERQHTHPAGDITGLDAAIAGKADKRVPAAAGNLAALDGAGNLADTGKKPGDFAQAAHSHSKSEITDFAHSHSAGEITAGELPLARGGTGAGTAAGARGNLDVWSKGECLTDDTCAMLGLPATATPNQALAALPGFFPFQQVTAKIAAEFGTKGSCVKGRFQAPVSVVGNSAQVYPEYPLNHGITLLQTPTPEEYIACFTAGSKNTQVIQRFSWDGQSFVKVGATFQIESNYPRSVFLLDSGKTNEYVCMWIEPATDFARTVVQYLRWTGSAFTPIGNKFYPYSKHCDSAAILNTEVPGDYILSNRFDPDASVQRIRWNGSGFHTVGNTFTILGRYINPFPSSNALTGVSNEYQLLLLFHDTNGEKAVLQRIRWDGSSFSKVGNEFMPMNVVLVAKLVISTGFSNEILMLMVPALSNKYNDLFYVGWTGNEYSIKSSIRNSTQSSGSFASVFKTDEVGKFILYTNLAYKSGWMMYRFSASPAGLTVIDEPRPATQFCGNGAFIAAPGTGENINVGSANGETKAIRFEITSINATALQTAAPNEKVWVVKE